MNTTVALPAVVADQLTEVLHSLDAMHTLAQLATGEDRVMAGTFAVALAEMAEVN